MQNKHNKVFLQHSHSLKGFFIPIPFYLFICLFVYLLIPVSVLAAAPTDGTYTLMFNSYAGGGGNAIGSQLSVSDTNALCEIGGTGQCKIPLSRLGEVTTPGGNGISSADTAALCEAGGSGLCRLNAGYPSIRRSRYKGSGSFTSTNLLTGIPVVAAISTFSYTLTILPANTTATVQFSQNGTSWYKSDGTLNGSDSLSVGGAAIDLTALNWSGANFYYKVSFTGNGAGTPTLTGITLTYATNSKPAAPSFVSYPSSGCGGTAPQITLSSTDTQSDYIKYKIAIDTNNPPNPASGNYQLFDETASQTVWSGQNSQAATAYASGATATFNIPASLASGSNYYAQSWATDPGGSNTWSNASSVVSFLMTAPPSSPALTPPPNSSAASLIPQVKIISTNPCSQYQRYKMQIATDTGFTQNVQTFDSTTSIRGWSQPDNPSAAGAYNPGSTATYTFQTPLAEGTTYYWRSWAINPSSLNTWSSPAAYGTFTTALGQASSPSLCTVKYDSTAASNNSVVSWTNTSTTANQFTIQKSTDGGAFTALTTVASSTTSTTDTISTGHSYQYRVQANNTTNGVNSGWCTTSPIKI